MDHFFSFQLFIYLLYDAVLSFLWCLWLCCWHTVVTKFNWITKPRKKRLIFFLLIPFYSLFLFLCNFVFLSFFLLLLSCWLVPSLMSFYYQCRSFPLSIASLSFSLFLSLLYLTVALYFPCFCLFIRTIKFIRTRDHNTIKSL